MRKVIIGLLILLIVGVVAIIFTMPQIEISKEVRYLKKQMIFKDFQTRCEDFCREYSTSGDLTSAALFCSTRLLPPRDTKLLKPGKVDVIKSKWLGLIEPWDVCEDAIFCPHFYVCSKNNETITWSKCREIMCEYYSRRYDPMRTSQKVVEVMQNRAKYPWGSCELPKDNNWWYKYFGDEPCTNPP